MTIVFWFVIGFFLLDLAVFCFLQVKKITDMRSVVMFLNEKEREIKNETKTSNKPSNEALSFEERKADRLLKRLNGDSTNNVSIRKFSQARAR